MSGHHNPYEMGLDKNEANFAALTPLSLIRRTAAVHPARIAVVHGPLRRSYAELYARCRKLASALARRGIGVGDTVSIMAPNIPECVEAHFGVPMCGAVLNALNIRLDADAIAFILNHAETKVLITDRSFSDVVRVALHNVSHTITVIDIDDPMAGGEGALIGEMDYEAFLAEGDADFDWAPPDDEWRAIALNYTSGTTGDPKGVVYHHRGAYLNALGNALTWAMPHYPVYLWTLPMFHCNGWCFPWTITAMAGTHVCLRAVRADAIFKAIVEEKVTHMCGAPIVMSLMANAPEAERPHWDHALKMMTAGAAPPAATLEKMARLGVEVIHVYGLTEVYGPCVVCEWDPSWTELPIERQAAIKARQGVTYVVQEGLTVKDAATMETVPYDGETMGEVMMRGNITMRGYLKNPSTTDRAFEGGWFRSGDLGVIHPDGYIELKDRSKDIIISGGENISTIEVEGVLYKHAAVAEAAVVARPDEKWGETPCAFVTLKPGEVATEEELIAFTREHLAKFKCPKTVVFADLPKTSTGKIQKFVLRQQAKALEQAAEKA